MADSSSNITNTSEDLWSCRWPGDEPWNNTLSDTPTLWTVLVIWPALHAICIAGNILIILVQINEKHATTTSVYLATMSVANVILICFTVPRYYYITATGSGAWDIWRSFPAGAAFEGVRYWIIMTANWTSDWTLVVFQLERLISTTNPLKFRTTFTVKRSKCAVAVVAVASAVINVEYPVSIYYNFTHDYVLSPGIMLWDAIMLMVEVVSICSIWTILTVGNVILAVVLAKHKQHQRKLSATLSNNSAGSLILVFSSTVMFTVLQFPFITYTILEIGGYQPYCSMRFTLMQDALMWPVVITLQLADYSVEFFVFCLFSTKFRAQLKATISAMTKRVGFGKRVRGVTLAESPSNRSALGAGTKRTVPG